MTGAPHLRSVEPARVAGGLGAALLDSARYAVDDDKTVAAYAIVTLYGDGSSCVGCAAEFGEDTLMNKFAFVGMASELIRDNMVTTSTARHIVNRANGFED